jgi:hypothetical protein
VGQDGKKDTPESVSLQRAIAERLDIMAGPKGRLLRIRPLPPAPEPSAEPDQQAELQAKQQAELEAGLAAERLANDLQAEARAELPSEPEAEPEAEQPEQPGWAQQGVIPKLLGEFPPDGIPPAGMSIPKVCRQIGVDERQVKTVKRAIKRLRDLRK